MQCSQVCDDGCSSVEEESEPQRVSDLPRATQKCGTWQSQDSTLGLCSLKAHDFLLYWERPKVTEFQFLIKSL